MFDTVLVANRGEIAVRIISTLRRMGIRSVAVYSDADAGAPHVRLADIALHIGPTPARESYLDPARIVDAAMRAGAQAVHPGYGFLSEDPQLARACAQNGIAFIGPPAEVIARMGDKISAKNAAIAAGVPVVPGRHDVGMSDEEVAAAVRDIGFPALLKPAAGGGGKGMRVIDREDQIGEAIAGARREARASFGDDALLVERFVSRPRHIEVQVLADGHGNVVHLGERECTLQRRHQKVVEEAPSVFLSDDVRAELCASAVRLAEAVGYVNAGTVEYVVSGDDAREFAFLEMNTRLQVEHPVTELVTGIDLVEWQVRIAAGEALNVTQSDIVVNGHAVEVRVYAEDPDSDFLPTGGEILLWRPAPEVRTDSGIATGQTVGSAYDPMLAKVIAHADTRERALSELRDALSRTVLLGVTSNIDYLHWLLGVPDVVRGEMDTALLGRLTYAPAPIDSDVIALAAAAVQPERQASPWRQGDNWRLGGCAPIRCDIAGRQVSVERREGALAITIDDHRVTRSASLPSDVDVCRDGEALWLHAPEFGHRRLDVTWPIDRRLRQRSAEGVAAGLWQAVSPMPGTVIDLPFAVGDEIAQGETVAVVEAMKMEHSLRAPWAARVSEIAVVRGATVARNDVLVTLEPIGKDT